mmetsp:Transcript_56556/g.85512  ORF Transcript_56556/g.85512 Transcript_56556/m.85512 type:complete len:123 (+) Transcript_56556:1088-1456(+)
MDLEQGSYDSLQNRHGEPSPGGYADLSPLDQYDKGGHPATHQASIRSEIDDGAKDRQDKGSQQTGNRGDIGNEGRRIKAVDTIFTSGDDPARFFVDAAGFFGGQVNKGRTQKDIRHVNGAMC